MQAPDSPHVDAPRDPAGKPSAAGRLLRASGRYLLLGLSWMLLWRISALMGYAPHASLWFPPAGLTFAALLVMRWRAVPVLLASAVGTMFWGQIVFPSHLSGTNLVTSGLAFGVAHCAAYGTGAELLRRLVRSGWLGSLPLVIVGFLVLGSLSALGAALSGVASLRITGLITASGARGLWLPWWIGDMAGTLVLTPMFLGLLSRGYPGIQSWLGGLDFRARETAYAGYLGKLAILLALLSLVLVLAAQVHQRDMAFAVFFLILPQMWIVYTESPFRTALSLAAFSTVLALWVAALRLIDQAVVYQYALCVIATSAYFGLAVPALTARNRQLRERAEHDGLTGVASKEHFFERSAQLLAESRRNGHPAALVVLDLDRFKNINDRSGHATGDRALVCLASVLRSHLRSTDLVGRFGGDEFMILLLGSNRAQAVDHAERLRRQLRETVVPGTDHHLAASFGVVGIEPGESLQQAFQRADQLLLDVKRNGRNRNDMHGSDGSTGRKATP